MSPPDSDSGPNGRTLRDEVALVMSAAWTRHGYTSPNPTIYPWMWLWDSCFHALIWAALDRPDRAIAELYQALSTQDDTGFVAHMGYQEDPHAALDLWSRSGSSTITQPPMYGHAVAELVHLGVDVPEELVARATRGVRFLLETRARDRSGLVRVVHPWETGCDDSPRWDDRCPGTCSDSSSWRRRKRELVKTVVRGEGGEPIDNPQFSIAPVNFNALLAFNARELASVTGDGALHAGASGLTDALASRWDESRATWIDAGSTESGSGRIRTSDALLPLLVVPNQTQRRAVIAGLTDPTAFGSSHGPRGVHREEPTYDPGTYWRGAVWPQIAYLLWFATASSDDADERQCAADLSAGTIRGARRSGLAEYWDGDTGAGGGAMPQSWSGLPLVFNAEE